MTNRSETGTCVAHAAVVIITLCLAVSRLTMATSFGYPSFSSLPKADHIVQGTITKIRGKKIHVAVSQWLKGMTPPQIVLVQQSSWTIDALKARRKQPHTATPQYLFFLNNADTPEHFSLMNFDTGYMVLSDDPILRSHIVDGLSIYQIHVHDLLEWATAIGHSAPSEAPAAARLGTFHSTLTTSRLTTLDPMEQSRQLLAILLLRAQGQPGDIPLVARFLSHPNVEHRRKAVALIKELMTRWPNPPDPTAKKYLIQALYDPDPGVFSSTLRGLNDFKDPDLHLSLQRAAHYWSQRPWGLEHVRQICHELNQSHRPTMQECINARAAVHNLSSTSAEKSAPQ